MQYAEIVPRTKTELTKQVFTYAIPPALLPHLQVGSLVLIPFGKRKIEGIIVKMLKKTTTEIKEKLKPISAVIEKGPLLNQTQLALAQWMTQEYFAPLSQTLFEMIPLPPKRPSRPKTPMIPEKNLPAPPYPKLVSQLCQKAGAAKGQVLVLAPDFASAASLFLFLKQQFANIALYHGELNKGERFRLWQKIKDDHFQIVCGTRSAIFLPFSHLSLIILLDEESEAYKNERSPRYQTKEVALKLAQLTQSRLFIISATPSLWAFAQAQKRRIQLLRPKPLCSPLHLYLVDLKNEIKKGNHSPISDRLKSEILRTYQKKGKTILFVPRRGAASYIFCRECGYLLRCPHCELPLTYHLHHPQNRLLCHHCLYQTSPPSLCPNCQGTWFRYGGVGSQRVEAEIKKWLIKPNILRLEQEKLFQPEALNNAEIIIATPKIFYLHLPPVDLVGIVSIDHLLNLADFSSSEKIFAQLNRLAGLAKQTLLLQTYHPNNPLLRVALKRNWSAFLKQEISLRQKLALPPFFRLIRLIYQHKNEAKCEKEANLVASKLKALLENFSGKFIVLGPSPCFYAKIKGRYRWQIVLKIPTHQPLPTLLRHFLQRLPRDWILDANPVTIL